MVRNQVIHANETTGKIIALSVCYISTNKLRFLAVEVYY